MGRLLDRIRVMDARLIADRPYIPAPRSDGKVVAVFVLLGVLSLVGGLTLLAEHLWLRVACLYFAYLTLWPHVAVALVRRFPSRNLKRLLLVSRLPWLAVRCLTKGFESPVVRAINRMLPPDEKLRVYDSAGTLTQGSVWVVTDKALYLWPIAHADPAQRNDITRLPFAAIRRIYDEALADPGLVRRCVVVSSIDDDVDEHLVMCDVFRLQGSSRLLDLVRAGMLGVDIDQPPSNKTD